MAKKYIDAELLKKEIEELEGLEYPCDNSEQNVGFEYALDRVSDIITSLQQEQPCDTCTNDKGCVTCKDGELWEGKEQPSEELESEIEKYFQGLWPGMETAEQCNTDMHFTPPAIMRLANHFYELGKQSKEPISEDLEKAADKYVYDWAGLSPTERRIAERAYLAGAEWQRQRTPMPEDTVIFQKGIEEGKRLMIEEAVEGVVYRYESFQRIATSIIVDIPREDLGNKVKIIIVPEKED